MTMHEQVRPQLSAYLDRELTQAAGQRVRIHLEDCEECRRAFRQLQDLQKVAGEMQFINPPENKMNELKQRLSVRLPRRAGWGFLLLGVLSWIAYGFYLLVTDPPAATMENLIVAAIYIGLGLLLASAARRRWVGTAA